MRNKRLAVLIATTLAACTPQKDRSAAVDTTLPNGTSMVSVSAADMLADNMEMQADNMDAMADNMTAVDMNDVGGYTPPAIYTPPPTADMDTTGAGDGETSPTDLDEAPQQPPSDSGE